MATVRGHNEGSLFQRSRDGRWVAMVTMPNGSRRSASAASKKLAVALLRDLLRERDQSVIDPRGVRVGPYLRNWLARLTDVAPSTRRQHEMIVERHLIPALGKRRLLNLTPTDVETYLDSAQTLKKPKRRLDAQTRRHHRATLRLALSDAVRDGMLTRNVAALASAPKMDKAERPILRTDEIRRVIEEARAERLWPLWVLIATTGLRVSEALGLVWSDIDGDELRVEKQLAWVATGKGPKEPKRVRLKTRKSRRPVPLIPQAVEALAEQRRRQDEEREAAGVPEPIDGYVFLTVTGHPIQSTNILQPWYAVLVQMKLPRVTTHDLRHSAATMMYEAGIPIEAIADILGHSTYRVTADLYRHRVPEVQRAAAERLASVLRG